MQLKGLCWIGTNCARGREEDQKTWKRPVVEEAQRERRTWKEVKWLTSDRSRWRSFVEALCFYRRQLELMMMMNVAIETRF
jgi:hypothetical protein